MNDTWLMRSSKAVFSTASAKAGSNLRVIERLFLVLFFHRVLAGSKRHLLIPDEPDKCIYTSRYEPGNRQPKT